VSQAGQYRSCPPSRGAVGCPQFAQKRWRRCQFTSDAAYAARAASAGGRNGGGLAQSRRPAACGGLVADVRREDGRIAGEAEEDVAVAGPGQHKPAAVEPQTLLGEQKSACRRFLPPRREPLRASPLLGGPVQPRVGEGHGRVHRAGGYPALGSVPSL
jgi:hypothetical protein